MPTGVAERLALIEEVARENLAEARAMVAAFSPVALDSATLVEALERLVERFGRETGLATRLDTSALGDGGAELSRSEEVVLLRGAQEALANVRRHASATAVVLRVSRVGAGESRAGVGARGGRRGGLRPGGRAGRRAGGAARPGRGGRRRGRRRLGAGAGDARDRAGAGPMTVRVLVVDDHPVVRGGVVGWLAAQPDIDVVAEAADGLEALAAVAEHAPDVVLMDLRMPRMDGVAATERIAAAHPAVRVLVLTTYDTDADIVRAVEAGATGYLLKDTPLPQLADAVRAAARGETVLAPPVAARLVSRMRAPAVEAPTARELEVLAGVARGLTNAEIGRELFIGEATVKTHLLRVFAKLGVDDRTRAVMVAVERGLLPNPGT